jgi:DNA modification methylase
MGVGSTGVAALQMGRRFIGIEMAETFFRVAVDRCRNVYAQTFVAYVKTQVNYPNCLPEYYLQ